MPTRDDERCVFEASSKSEKTIDENSIFTSELKSVFEDPSKSELNRIQKSTRTVKNADEESNCVFELGPKSNPDSKSFFNLNPDLIQEKSCPVEEDPKAAAQLEPRSDPDNVIWNLKKAKAEQKLTPKQSETNVGLKSPAKPTTLNPKLDSTRENSGRLRDRIKMFVSRPIREKDLKKVAVRAEAKTKSLEKIKAKPPNDDFYPREDSAPFRFEDFFKFRRREQECGRSHRPAENLKIPDILPSTGLPTIKNNKNNNGHLFMEGFKPFWCDKLKPEKEDMEPGTEEDLPANAAVVLDVCQGRTVLQQMPTQPVEINPVKEVEDMKTLDSVFFTRDVVFGNTIRNIIVNNEESSRRSRKKTLNFKTQEAVVVVGEPKTYRSYRYRSISTSQEKKFRPSKKN